MISVFSLAFINSFPHSLDDDCCPGTALKRVYLFLHDISGKNPEFVTWLKKYYAHILKLSAFAICR